MNNLQTEKQVILLAPANVTNGATATANLDTKGHSAVDITVQIGAFAGGTNGAPPATIKLGESDDTVATNFADITGATANASLTASGNVRFNVNLKGRKRYLRLTFAPAANGTNDAVIVGAMARFDRSAEMPESTSEYGDTIVKVI